MFLISFAALPTSVRQAIDFKPLQKNVTLLSKISVSCKLLQEKI
jgi:hypothetical protein